MAKIQVIHNPHKEDKIYDFKTLKKDVFVYADTIEVRKSRPGAEDNLLPLEEIIGELEQKNKNGRRVWFISCGCSIDYKISLLLDRFGKKISIHYLTGSVSFNEDISDFLESDKEIKALLETPGCCSCEDGVLEKILAYMIIAKEHRN